jgi:hypothetical protein
MLLPNGPDGATDECHDQEDVDDDGYGNACDLDFNNDDGVGADDLGAFLINTNQTNLVMDSNCDGALGADDLGNVLNALGSQPGVSGLYAQHSCSCPEPLTYGCTDPNADNHDSQADLDDGSCYLAGCMDLEASNYDAQATVDDGSCYVAGCMDPEAPNYTPAATWDDGSCCIGEDYHWFEEDFWSTSIADYQHPGACCPSGQIYIPADMPGITPESLDALNAGGDDENDDDACYPFNFSWGGFEGSWGNWLGSDFPFG